LAVLADLLEVNTALHANLAEQREAIRRADSAHAQRLVEAHTHLVSRLAALDQRRREVVVSLSKSLAWPHGTRTPSLSELAQRLPEPERSRALQLAERTRERLGQVHRESASLRAAARTLAAHMEGLLRHVGRQFTGAGVYSPRGQVSSGGSLAVALDLKT
jgi:hypothetical protein